MVTAENVAGGGPESNASCTAPFPWAENWVVDPCPWQPPGTTGAMALPDPEADLRT